MKKLQSSAGQAAGQGAGGRLQGREQGMEQGRLQGFRLQGGKLQGFRQQVYLFSIGNYFHCVIPSESNINPKIII